MQFFYERKEPQAPKEGDTDITWKVFTDSFNPDMVVRTIEYEPGKISLLLTDGHEEARDVPTRDEKGRQGIKRERQWIASQIFLNETDTQRYRDYNSSYVPNINITSSMKERAKAIVDEHYSSIEAPKLNTATMEDHKPQISEPMGYIPSKVIN